ncbi:DNA internalization-related competence protein ComEC/Rec2 [Fructobacillus papyrifericola]|uniref:DNA internalization-related competence protein ComEC/Rec2 n=1 Tax=Fructobacillus papyrifericola TaxID=2713172 RepID=A0ABS5QTN2_9LACO|nr:DNA internalization-related competence protein ComEC/Rec2 [Fructobacillus papyrifericola]MBS9335761.1 DNA internalization-related competence protein ComEC/Rec2 [Fructobacillus papyrifericola]
MLVYRQNAMTETLLLATALLSLTLNDQRQLLLLWLFTLLFFLYCHFDNRHLLQASQRGLETGPQSLIVQPDQFRRSEDGVISGQGRTVQGEKQLFFYQAKSQAEMDRFAAVKETVAFVGSGESTPVMGATNDYQFDFRQYWRSQKVTQQVRFERLDIQQAKAANPLSAVMNRLHALHARAARMADGLPNPLRDYALSLLLAAKGSQLYDNNPMIAELGLIHLFALSGLHVSFLSNYFRKVCRRLRIDREVADGLLAVLLPLFYLFTGSPSVLFRATVAGELRIFSQNFNRPLAPIQIWSYSLILSLLLAPQILLTLGGQLSFALTLAVTLSSKLSVVKRAFFLSLVTFPLIVSSQYVWNLWQTVANLIAIPVFTTLVLPATLLGYSLSFLPVLPMLCNGLIQLFDSAVALFGRLPGQLVVGALTWPILVLLFLLPFSALSLDKRGKRALLLAWVVLLTANWLMVRFPSHGEWTTFDIGQGDAAVLIEPRHQTVTMIDTGGKVQFGPRPHFETGGPKDERTQVKAFKRAKQEEGLARSVILPYLHARGIRHINTLALSHQDQDHIGDSRVILENFTVDRLVIPAGMAELPAFQKKIQPYLKQTKVVEATDQTTVPNCPLIIRYPFFRGEAGNDDSLAWTGRFGGQNIYTAGDLDRDGEEKILAKYPDFAPDIVKFGHHGSKTATSPTVFAQWQPKVGLVSAGRNSRYGHPHQEVLDVANKEGMIVYSTQTQGMLRYSYQGKHGHFEVSRHEPSES